MKSTSQAKSRNQILANLRSADFSLLEAHLGYVELRVPKQLESPNKRIDHVYFIESGFASVVANGGARRQQIEIGLIGREGMTGLAVLMGNDRSPIETYMQLAGAGLRITAEHLREAIGQASLCIIRFCVSGMRSTFKLHKRHSPTFASRSSSACRAGDRVDGDELLLTHEFLSLMLGVRRASITQTLRTLVEDDLIAIRRGTIAIVDRVRLQKNSNGAYIPTKPK